MTTEQIEMTGIIAKYDGWKVIPEGTYIECHNQIIWFGHGGKFNCYYDITPVSNMLYLTSMDWLHPIAMKVREKLRIIGTHKAYKHVQYIDCACCLDTINGQYIDLFTAVFNGIVFLNEQTVKP